MKNTAPGHRVYSGTQRRLKPAPPEEANRLNAHPDCTQLQPGGDISLVICPFGPYIGQMFSPTESSLFEMD
jgi:hypothetical protein